MLPRGEHKAAYAGDAGQGFSAKAHGADRAEVLGAADLAGGMAFEAEQGVIAAHAETIIGDPDQAAAARLDFHGQARGLRIQRVLDQFLHHAGRPFHHFAGGDLVGDLFR